MTQYGFHFDGKRCTGCKTCVLACKDNKDLSAEISFRRRHVEPERWIVVQRRVRLLRLRRVQPLR